MQSYYASKIAVIHMQLCSACMARSVNYDHRFVYEFALQALKSCQSLTGEIIADSVYECARACMSYSVFIVDK
jgi:hypothetical protein